MEFVRLISREIRRRNERLEIRAVYSHVRNELQKPKVDLCPAILNSKMGVSIDTKRKKICNLQ
jgi:hypothetical protein